MDVIPKEMPIFLNRRFGDLLLNSSVHKDITLPDGLKEFLLLIYFNERGSKGIQEVIL